MLKRIDPNNIEELCSFLDGRMSDADPAILQRVSAILERVEMKEMKHCLIIQNSLIR